MENLQDGFFMNVYFTPGDKGENETKRFFRDNTELANIIVETLDKFKRPRFNTLYRQHL